MNAVAEDIGKIRAQAAQNYQVFDCYCFGNCYILMTLLQKHCKNKSNRSE